MVQVAFAVVMAREGGWATVLEEQAAAVGEAFPQWAEVAWRAAEQGRRPVADTEVVRELLDSFGRWAEDALPGGVGGERPRQSRAVTRRPSALGRCVLTGKSGPVPPVTAVGRRGRPWPPAVPRAGPRGCGPRPRPGGGVAVDRRPRGEAHRARADQRRGVGADLRGWGPGWPGGGPAGPCPSRRSRRRPPGGGCGPPRGRPPGWPAAPGRRAAMRASAEAMPRRPGDVHRPPPACMPTADQG
jgi:hypothetical protein